MSDALRSHLCAAVDRNRVLSIAEAVSIVSRESGLAANDVRSAIRTAIEKRELRLNDQLDLELGEKVCR